jgi:UDP-N-acetylglucosamine--N-acetylmuramyl-(pentapeptide) pyrophosphoryl-undecaprenol N-acetylglucosamine transferase
VGLPLRTAITKLAAEGRASQRATARAAFGLADDLFTLLVSGGSQGARSINMAVLSARDRLLAHGVQILHVWGPRNFSDDLASVTDPVTGARYQPVAYVDDMERAYAAADVMLGRSGAGTVVETATVGLPSILVPLAIGNGEQARNARALVDARAAIVIPDQELTSDRLTAEVERLAEDPALVASMGQAAQALMAPGAAERVGSIVLSCAGGGQ